MEKIRKAEPQLTETTTEYPPSYQFTLEPVGIELEFLCTTCMNVFKFMPFGTYLKEKDGKHSLVAFVAPITGKAFVCKSCREGGTL